MKLKKELISREIAGERFLVPVGKSVYDANGLFFLTAVGEFLWDRLAEAQGVEDLLKAVLEEYDVEESVARKDITSFLEKLRLLEIID